MIKKLNTYILLFSNVTKIRTDAKVLRVFLS